MNHKTQTQFANNFGSYLKHLQFPAGKQEILQAATRNQTPQDVLELIRLFPDRKYDSMEDFVNAFGADARPLQGTGGTSATAPRINGVNDTSRVGENGYWQRGVDESAGSSYRSGGPTSNGFTREEFTGGDAR